MATIKSYTDLQQSKKLAEILPLESADMYWKNAVSDKYIQCFTPFIIDDIRSNVDFDYDIPCWSLTALLSVLNFPSLTQNKENEWEVCVFDHDNDDYIEKTASNPVDACYEMIKSLHELNLL